MLHTLPVAQQQHIAHLLMGELVINEDEESKIVVSLADYFDQLSTRPLTDMDFTFIQPSTILLFGKQLHLVNEEEGENVLSAMYSTAILRGEVPISLETALMLGATPIYDKAPDGCKDAACGCAVSNQEENKIDEEAFKLQSSIAGITATLEELNHHLLQFAPHSVFIHAFPGSEGTGATVYVTPVSKPLYFIAPTASGVVEPGQAMSFETVEFLLQCHFFYSADEMTKFIQQKIQNIYGKGRK